MFVIIEAVWGLLQFCGVVPSNHTLFGVTGSLFNPAPYAGFIAAGLPVFIAVAWSLRRSGIVLAVAVPALLLIVVSLLLAQSRAAWIAAVAGILMWLWLLAGRKMRVVPVLIAVVAGAVAGLYFLRPDSADGRLLIWKAAAGLIGQHPWLGAGYGRFADVYPLAQAAWFQKGTATVAEQLLASVPAYAYNEYLRMAVETGFVGLLLLLGLAALSIAESAKYAAQNAAAMVAFLTFAAFSYPLSVLPVAMLFVMLLSISANHSPLIFMITDSWALKYQFRISIFPSAIIFVFCTALSISILSFYPAYCTRAYASMLLASGDGTVAEPEFAALYDRLQGDRIFLTEYAHCLSDIGKYGESNRIISQELIEIANPLIINIYAHNCGQLGMFQEAEQAWLLSEQITPGRFYPCYRLMQLYSETGQHEKASAAAHRLLDKPIKVPSKTISDMQAAARQLLAR
ncbi:MAG: O-antigen ligase family protein [Bacteroidales bacterium]|nr:O-antigen ligase family protein [Bacteroidales bacterium]